MKGIKSVFLLLAVVVFSVLNVHAQQKKKPRRGEFYFSWGYNKEWYTRSNVRIIQPGLGNNYRFTGIEGHDHPGWNEGLCHLALSIPQYFDRYHSKHRP